MKKTVLLALTGLLLAGCKNQSASADTQNQAQTSQTQTSQTQTGQAQSNQTQADQSVANVVDQAVSGTSAAKPGPVPSGYTRVPDLSKTPVRSFKSAPPMALKDGEDYAAVIDTTKGQMVIDLFEDVPTSTNSFIWLARHHFYDGILFHRVIDGFVVQGGDPNTLKSDRNLWGQGGPGYTIPLEVRTKYNFDQKGVLGMARAQDPDSGGSQFYITLAPAPSLDGQYTVFGKVVQGEDVLDKITKYEPPAAGTPDKMLDVYIVTKNK